LLGHLARNLGSELVLESPSLDIFDLEEPYVDQDAFLINVLVSGESTVECHLLLVPKSGD
jgi:hypothetical protein